MKQQTFTLCNNFDTKRCPQEDHEYMKIALRIHEGSPSAYLPQDGEKAFKANELCKDCDKFTPFFK